MSNLSKWTCTSLIIFMVTSFAANPKAQAAIPPKAKAFLIVSGYGAAGGALLGFASMAFGNSGRAIAQGASLGLYAGIIFGAYVLISHEYKGSEFNQGYQDADTIYGDEGDAYDGDFFDSPRRYQSMFELDSPYKVKNRNGGGSLIYTPVLNLSF